MSRADGQPFEASFGFRGAAREPGNLSVEALSAHEAPDAIARAFEGGVVLANPARHAVDFDVGILFPGARLRRLPGARDLAADDGAAVPRRLTLPQLDAAFLARG